MAPRPSSEREIQIEYNLPTLPFLRTTAMPLRAIPKIHQLLLRTHKLTIFLTLPPSTTIAQVKEEALSAFVSEVNQAHAEIDGTPTVASVDDFELCRVVRDKDPRMGPTYEVLDTRRSLRDYGFSSWETLFFRFKSDDGELMPATAVMPSIDDEDVADTMSDEAPVRSTNKGKRKAPPADESE
ncbi:hypothetical protein APHAL10511_001570 [Amanita phalloides]|nr:hypothetical protein APHAL10511_001570 [Amanita phalloides]